MDAGARRPARSSCSRRAARAGPAESGEQGKMDRVEMALGRHTLSIETGKMAKQADGAVVVRLGDTVVLATACAQREPRVGFDFLPLTVDYREGNYASGQDPRRLLQARGPAEREGGPDLPDDRPPAAAALPRGLRVRDAGHRPAALGGPGERLGHPGHHRRLDRARDLRHPVRPAGGRGARRLLGRGLRHQPRHRRPQGEEPAEPAGGRHRGRDRHGGGERPAR